MVHRNCCTLSTSLNNSSDYSEVSPVTFGSCLSGWSIRANVRYWTLPPLLWQPLQSQGTQENNEDYSQFHSRQSSLFLGGKKADSFFGGCEKLVLTVEVVPEKGDVFFGYFVETLTLKERRVAGSDFRCNLVNNWSGDKMCLLGIRIDHSLDVLLLLRGYCRRMHLTHEIPKIPRHHRRRPRVWRVGDFGQYTTSWWVLVCPLCESGRTMKQGGAWECGYYLFWRFSDVSELEKVNLDANCWYVKKNSRTLLFLMRWSITCLTFIRNIRLILRCRNNSKASRSVCLRSQLSQPHRRKL